MGDPFKNYLQELEKNLAGGDAGEHTHRPALKTLLESLAEGLTATNEPNQITDCGKPDMTMSRGPVRLGNLETKDIGKNLDKEEKSKQIKDYREGFPNFILTDYLEFRWYVKGERRFPDALFSLGVRDGDRIIKGRKEDLEAIRDLLGQFISCRVPTIGTAKELARRMAALARIMQGAAEKTLEEEPPNGTLRGWLAEFEENLIKNLTPGDFADMYTQTLTYGLFAAKVTVGTAQELTRETAARLIPETNPFLKKLFYHLAGPEVPDTVAWVIEDLIALLNKTDWEAVLRDFGRGSIEQDPVVHFYETFLARYAPEKRERRGVYYTPEPVVSYIVRAIDHLLKERFGRPLGLADPDTLILDPACGTGTFLHSVVALIHDTLTARGQSGGWNAYVAAHLLPRVFGFELLMAPYSIAHLKLALLLKEKGYTFVPGQRLGVYLTNTLDEGFKPSKAHVLAGYITEESNTAARIKQEDLIEVVLGNPPYSGHSANKGEWIRRLIEDYKQVDGRPLGEKNPKMLQDDYVKFLRWGQWRISLTGKGIMAMITNHGYLDNPTFRGMRQQLLESFNEIYLLNLHGNARKKERCPDGSKDENVFDIQQGVAIGIFVKLPDRPEGKAAVRYVDLWGKEKGKNDWLAQNELVSTSWTTLEPRSPFYLFIPQDTSLGNEYEQFWKVTDIFPLNSTGVKTHRDHFVFDFEKAVLRKRIEDFRNLENSDTEIAERYNLNDTVNWKLRQKRRLIASDEQWERCFTNCLYHPFDIRVLYYNNNIVDRPRNEIMGHILAGDNLGLMVSRQVAGQFRHIFVTKIIPNFNLLDTAGRFGSGPLIPLYLYPPPLESYKGRCPNLNPKFIEDLSQRLGLSFVPDCRGDLQTTFGPEDVFYYIYAVFHSPTYRRRYAEFLKVDFPRLPLTSDKNLFVVLAAKGAELAALHLMESPSLERFITSFPVSGDNRVEKVRYAPPESVGGTGVPPVQRSTGETPVPPSFLQEGRVYINANQYFKGIPPDLWAFQVGGYQVLLKWLKDRRGRILTWDDITYYQRIVVALKETLRLMGEIDAAIPQWPLT